MGFLRSVGLFGAAFVGVLGGHMLVSSIIGSNRPQPQQPQQPQAVEVTPVEALKYADYRTNRPSFGSEQQQPPYK